MRPTKRDALSLYWQLSLRPKLWLIAILVCWALLLAQSVGQGEKLGLYAFGALVFLAGTMLNAGSDFAPYRVLGLPMSLWQRHRCITATIMMVLSVIAVLVAFPQLWWILIPVAAAYVWNLLDRSPRPEIAEPLELRMLRDSDGNTSVSRLPPEPKWQVVLIPQVRMWVFAWSVYLVVYLVFLGLVLVFGDKAFEWGGISLASGFFVGMAPFTGGVRTTLRNLLSFGGSRRQWARTTALASVASPVLALVLSAVQAAVAHWWNVDIAGMGWIFPMIGFLLPVVVVTAEVASAHNLLLQLLGLAVIIAVVVFWLAHQISSPVATALSAGIFILYFSCLPYMARTTNPWSGAISEWLGLKRADS